MRSPALLVSFAVLLDLALSATCSAQGAGSLWGEARCGSWLRTGPPQPGDVVLIADDNASLTLVIPKGETSIVRRAVRFLALDIARITGVTPLIASAPPGEGPSANVHTASPASGPRWEAYAITVGDGRVVVRGSDPRGTAFGVYELCERLGVDPLYHWTGFTPKRVLPLVVKGVRYEQGSPAVRFRGLFHDDEDILPRPKAADRRPDARGTVPTAWYERFFETALRLRLNMVAPWVRTQRRFEIQKMASDWGLYYTSHHYDTLLSDPYQFTRGDLAEKRGVKPVWDWLQNQEGMIKYWHAGVVENADLQCIWPIGMRGTNDYGYRFPADWTAERKLAAFNEAFAVQVGLVSEHVPEDRERLFHFTMYTEMLPFYQTGGLRVPQEVIIVWPDDNDGVMRGLPSELGEHRHGVYYHLAYLGGRLTKQTHQVVPLGRIEQQFRAIHAAGATEFCLVNVSELREYVLGTRFIADICWNGPVAFAQPDSAKRFLDWWCREYFSEQAAPATARAYNAYFDLLPKPELLGYGAGKCLGAIPSLRKKFRGRDFLPAMPETLPTLKQRQKAHAELLTLLGEARAAIPEGEPRRFFFENLELAAAIDRLPTDAAVLLVAAMSEPDRQEALNLCLRALPFLDELDLLLRRAERWPFDSWYGPTWIKPRNRKLVFPRRELVKLLREFVDARPHGG